MSIENEMKLFFKLNECDTVTHEKYITNYHHHRKFLFLATTEEYLIFNTYVCRTLYVLLFIVHSERSVLWDTKRNFIQSFGLEVYAYYYAYYDSRNKFAIKIGLKIKLN